ncbi:P-loop containing nucleoside triphosphate hydrolase protein [Lipomyces starkeyi]|uniref:DNA 3'-5' helicase n=1 Tax=Lipomyces starkeyi NRRL Y-11557 TaxID=675824 RepID=A0A1E3Q1B5_LIPST|nr:hypothetical protein LIPSTDRAFT_64475 [Lipomyces starkeyi NRRL Y-11557]
MLYMVTKSTEPSITTEYRDDIDGECERYLVAKKSTSFSYCVKVHAACKKYDRKHTVPKITWATDDFSALRLENGGILTISSLKDFIKEQYSIAEDSIRELCLGLQVPTHYAQNMKDVYSVRTPGYSFMTEAANKLSQQYLWDHMLSDPTLRSRLLAGALYKVTNPVVEGYQQYLFSGNRGRFGADRLRKIIEHRTALSVTLHSPLNTQGLRQAIVAFLEKYCGHSQAVGVLDDNYAYDVQSGHSSSTAVSQYAVSDQDLPSTNRYDVHVFMLVSEAWFKVLGEESSVKYINISLQRERPSNIGQSVEHPVSTVHDIGMGFTEKMTIHREVTEVYPESVDAKLLPLTIETFRLLFELRGTNAAFRSAFQATSVQTIISNPGNSFLVVLPTGAALRYNIVDRENIDSGNFRRIFSELLFKKAGHSLIAKIIFDETHTILNHWEFRPSFQAIHYITNFSIPLVLLSATIPPSKLRDIRAVYSRPDLRLIRAPSTTRPNLVYSVRHVPPDRLSSSLAVFIDDFFARYQVVNRALVFCMSNSMVKELHDEYSQYYQRVGVYHGELSSEMKQNCLDAWIAGDYRLLFTTSGFGVGVDYESVSLVIHYQESGRAGRNGERAKSVVLLPDDWHPNYQKTSASDAQVVDDYIDPRGFCRRYDILFQYSSSNHE